MNPQDTKRLLALCAEIQKEEDPHRFSALVLELSFVLDKRIDQSDLDRRSA